MELNQSNGIRLAQIGRCAGDGRNAVTTKAVLVIEAATLVDRGHGGLQSHRRNGSADMTERCRLQLRGASETKP